MITLTERIIELELANRLNKPYAQVLADKPILAPKPQQPCDEGLFGDEHKQTELFK